jgi:hypothetical protein
VNNEAPEDVTPEDVTETPKSGEDDPEGEAEAEEEQ